MSIYYRLVRSCMCLYLTLLIMMPLPLFAASDKLLVTLAAQQNLLVMDSEGNINSRIHVGIAPWSVVTDGNGTAYVTTAEGLAVVDLKQAKRSALIPYQSAIGRPKYGEYRGGGMGLAISVDGTRVYVGVYTGSNTNQLEIVDTQQRRVIKRFEIQTRPFDVRLSPDEKFIASINHDSYSVTAIDLKREQSRNYQVAPLGFGGFDKPHYALFDDQGQLFLPVQGQAMAVLNITNGAIVNQPLTADTHQHGMAWRPYTDQMLIIGTGAAGRANGGPSLTIYDVKNHQEQIIPLKREHEQVIVSRDGRYAWLTGGQSFTGGWDGLSRVDLKTANVIEIPVSGQPFGIAVWSDERELLD